MMFSWCSTISIVGITIILGYLSERKVLHLTSYIQLTCPPFKSIWELNKANVFGGKWRLGPVSI